MNAALRHWKEAATLIVAAGRRLGADSVSRRGRFDYDVLLLKRSGKSDFMPNAYVFPGGAVDPADFSSEWLDVFQAVRNCPNFGLTRVKQPPETRPPIFATDRQKLGSPIPGEVAFRICALRETFEESGVLLVVPKRDETRLLESAEVRGDPGPDCGADTLCGRELTRWRALVNQNPSNFVRMCRELQVMPNIWALHEWSNWLTPRARYGVTRFDTAFFICCLPDAPHTAHDDREIERFQWSTPPEVLQSYQDKELWIAPPQFYELGRMCRFPTLNVLRDFARRRAAEGCERWTPVVFPKDEQYISLLPGDRFYPSDASGETVVDASADPQEQTALHRIVMSDSYTTTLQITVPPKYKHLLPLVEPSESRGPEGQR
ncbi:hypothetical protein Q5P01_006971 [Channa striata]|uniref:Acyl-coenzyme A diphosphatase NUDT19 n=1 Tax=Channa striata TaxID=64152 RepID=A0AA88NCB3_CHASR|nr:hypothetical protein Q5P01_006971 [Channa striata]